MADTVNSAVTGDRQEDVAYWQQSFPRAALAHPPHATQGNRATHTPVALDCSSSKCGGLPTAWPTRCCFCTQRQSHRKDSAKLDGSCSNAPMLGAFVFGLCPRQKCFIPACMPERQAVAKHRNLTGNRPLDSGRKVIAR